MDSEIPTTKLASGESRAAPAPLGEDEARAARQVSRRRAFHQMFIVVGLAVLVRIPQLRFPMGVTAGTAAYVGQQWLERGAVPYRDAWDYHAPGHYLLCGAAVRWVAPVVARAEQWLARVAAGHHGSVLRVTVGEAMPEACRAVMLAVGLATMFVVYRFVRRWSGRTEAVTAAGLCGFFTGTLLVQGDCLEAAEGMTLFVAVAMWAAVRSEGRRALWLAVSGLAAGVAACFEPLAVVYVAALLLWVAAANGGVGRLKRWVLRPSVLLIGAALPVACVAAYFWRHGALDALWRNAVVYNALYRWLPMAHRTPSSQWQTIRAMAPEHGALWLFAGGWALHAFSMGFRRETGLVALWGLASLVATFAVRQVVPAHFLQTVPPLAVGAALALTNPTERLLARDERGRVEARSAVLVLLALVFVAAFVYAERRAYLAQVSRKDLSTDQAAERVADMIRDHTMPGHSIYVWGVGPQVYVLADRPAAHRMFYNRPLNVAWLVREFFGEGIFEEIYWKLVREQPVFIVTTEEFLPDEPEPRGPMRDLFRFLREHYDLWQIVDAKPYSFAIYARKDRALLP